MKRLSLSLLVLLAFSTLAASRPASAEPAAVGTQAPSVSLPKQEGATVTLDQNKGKWVVLYFYPKDFTSGCTVEAHNFQRDLAKYEKAHAVILGVSVDTADSHQSFCATEGLSFKLLADTEKTVSEAYGSVMEYQGNKLSARNPFIIDPKGNIAKVFMSVKPMPHS